MMIHRALAVLVNVLVLEGCTTAEAECPAGELGCACRAGECNAGFVCDEDGICRDDEPPDTNTDTSSETSITTTTLDDGSTTVASESSTSIDPITSSTSGTTDPGTTTAAPQCVCGWDRRQGFYTCGDDLPPEGPPGVGQPICPEEGLLVGDPCDAVDPPITLEGCCYPPAFVAFCHPETMVIELQECAITKFGCVPVTQ